MKAGSKKCKTVQSPRPASDMKLKDHNLVKVNPKTEQFEPTASEMIPQRKRMAGY
jgi:hypothetical protein